MKRIPWGPVRSILINNFTFGQIKEIIGYTNIDMSKLAHLEQKAKNGATKSQLLSAIDQQIGSQKKEKRQSHINLLRRNASLKR